MRRTDTGKIACEHPGKENNVYCDEPATRFYPYAYKWVNTRYGQHKKRKITLIEIPVCEYHAKKMLTKGSTNLVTLGFGYGLYKNKNGHDRKWLTIEEYEIISAERKLEK